jgi:hypothetical protein
MGLTLPNIHLSIEVKQNDFIASLVFTNNSSRDLYLDMQTICFDGELERNLFTIVDEENKRIEYDGMMIKRDVEPDDFTILEAGETKEVNVKLNEAYKLTNGQKYQIQYVAFNPPYLDEQSLMKFQSNVVSVDY